MHWILDLDIHVNALYTFYAVGVFDLSSIDGSMDEARWC